MLTHDQVEAKFKAGEISFEEYMTTPVAPEKLVIKPSKVRGRRMAQRAGQMLMTKMEPQGAPEGIVRLVSPKDANLIYQFNFNSNPVQIRTADDMQVFPMERSQAEALVREIEKLGWKRQTLEATPQASSAPQINSAAQQAPLADEAGPFVAAPANLKTAENAKTFILAGNAYFTARSVTGTRYTFRVSLPKKDPKETCKWCHHAPCTCPQAWFVSYLSGPENSSDYTYLGMIKGGKFATTKASNRLINSQVYKAFRWVWEHLSINQMPPKTELWHEGRCGRCGHLLTVPESIESGIGPVCESKGGV